MTLERTEPDPPRQDPRELARLIAAAVRIRIEKKKVTGGKTEGNLERLDDLMRMEEDELNCQP